MVTNPKSSPENEACKNWLSGLVFKGFEIVIPEITNVRHLALFWPARLWREIV